MQFFFIILIICLILFLFKLYHISNDDFVLAKKNILLEEIFNSAFVCSSVALLFARVFYVLFNPDPVFLNPLGFLLFPYFPGLSLTGGVVGGILSLLIFSKINKFPVSRVFDFFSAAFIFILPIGLMGYILLSGNITVGNSVKLALFTIIFLTSNFYLYPKANALEIKDGTLSMLFLIFFSLISLFGSAIDHPGINYFVSHKENFILILILTFSLVLLVKQEIVGRIPIKNGK